MQVLNKLLKIFDRIIDILAFVAGAITILMMLGISTEVVTRYFFKSPVSGMLEASEVSLLWITFLAAAWLLRQEGHVNMDVVLNRLKPEYQAILNCVTSLLGALISLALFWYGTQVVWNFFRKGTLEFGNLEINVGYVLLAIPLGGILLFLQFLRRAYGYWCKSRALRQ
jgi:C4-dicarboxylate transporter, DctQ subunit